MWTGGQEPTTLKNDGWMEWQSDGPTDQLTNQRAYIMVVSMTKNLSVKWQNLVNQYTTKAVRWLVRHLLYSILGRFFPIAPAQIPKNRFTSLSGAILYPNSIKCNCTIWRGCVVKIYFLLKLTSTLEDNCFETNWAIDLNLGSFWRAASVL